jgi:hypothetical protein
MVDLLRNPGLFVLLISSKEVGADGDSRKAEDRKIPNKEEMVRNLREVGKGKR